MLFLLQMIFYQYAEEVFFSSNRELVMMGFIHDFALIFYG
jgi:hypothetical protein